MKILSGFAIAVVLGILGICFFVYSGLIDVSATTQESAPVKWILENTRVNSVQRSSEDIAVPDLSKNKVVANGAKAFDEMCVGCHGGPGVKPFLGAKDMNPPPPDLAETTEIRSPKEMFWVVKNGIRMTGMPAWGQTHNDDELWNLVAFMGQLQNMSGVEYQKLVASVKDDGHDHEHSAVRESTEHVELKQTGTISTVNTKKKTSEHGHSNGHDHSH